MIRFVSARTRFETLSSLEQPALTAFTSRLGTPYWSRGDLALYLGDCLEVMKSAPDGDVALTVTSPPYNIGKEYESTLPLAGYLEWTSKWVAEVYRITASTGAFWLNLGYVSLEGRAKAIPLPYLLWDRIPFFLLQEVVWHYGAGVAARLMFSPRNEKWLWYVKDARDYTFNLDAVRDPNVKYPNQKKNGRIRVNALGKNPGDVWILPKVTTGQDMNGRRASPERTEHPAQFPLAVAKRIVLACSNPGDIVFDPLVGSGSTLHAALLTGRAGVGIDRNERYLEIAARRLDAAVEAVQLELPALPLR